MTTRKSIDHSLNYFVPRLRRAEIKKSDLLSQKVDIIKQDKKWKNTINVPND